MIDEYLKALDIQAIRVTPIIHEDAISSKVYKIDFDQDKSAILKICFNEVRYRRELYFLESLKSQFPVPLILGKIEPPGSLKEAILMECLPGDRLTEMTLDTTMAWKMGELLARLHVLDAKKYGDLSLDENIPSEPIRELTLDFQKSMQECKNVVSPLLLTQAEHYFLTHLPQRDQLDGPCIVHRDFKPGNIISDNQKISGVIDWENARGSFSSMDFLRMDRLIWEKNQKTKIPFLEGYRSIRSLPNIEEILPLLRVVGALAAMGFTICRHTWNTTHRHIFEFHKAFLEQEVL